MTIGSFIGALVIGLIVGALGRLVVPGKQHIPIWLTIVVGIAAAFIGTFIAGAVGVAHVDWLELAIQVIVAALGVLVVAATYRRRRAQR
jgi:uncharacterized membrane protein YeaQ/YmgE (transglycosylase-associated protein family)